MKVYEEIGKLNIEKFEALHEEKVIITVERIKHIQEKRKNLFYNVRKILPEALFSPNYIYKDWNNREDTYILIKKITETSYLNIVVKVGNPNDNRHSKNSIITMIEIGEKTLKKIINNKKDYEITKN